MSFLGLMYLLIDKKLGSWSTSMQVYNEEYPRVEEYTKCSKLETGLGLQLREDYLDNI